ncbi:CAP domain-containing protein [Paracoccus gahaiensis]|uniref:CAP domain-containing protein n=1 Tax=Paracoccus gahaiensis TaxID=1706839 RepID=A0A4U0RFY3_9RHOB|nr:CAP domain-containing protein [Paracoccus gahaiensis]TJZ94097.1 CAP domain-containing protein [Paracoccus gahaiensis]
MFRSSLSLVCLMSLSACATGPMISLPETAPAAEEALAAQCAGNPEQGARLGAAVNAARAADGKTVLAQSEALDTIALSHACDMAQQGRADVAGSNGSNVVDRARSVGYPTCGVAQLVGSGGTPEGTVAAWTVPGPQREQVMGQLSYEIGSGVVQGADGRLWHSVVLGNDCQ